jgi:predicted nucleic-acid-binding protein
LRALDTNVLVRFLVEDDRIQAQKARRVVEEAGRAGAPLFVSAVVLCETVRVLGYRYKLPRPKIVETLGQLLFASQLTFDDRELVARALEAFGRGRGDFADYVIREVARGAGYTETLTFDRGLLGEEGFVEP